MADSFKIAALADFDSNFPPHGKTDDAVDHARVALNADISIDWISSADIKSQGMNSLNMFDGYWIAPGRFNDLEAGLRGVEFARKTGKPVLGTCGGCQNMVLEFARNVLNMTAAKHEAYDGSADELIIHKLSCSLRGRRMELMLDDRNGPVKSAYGTAKADEEYYCEFGINPAYEDRLRDRGLEVAARDGLGEARIYVLKDHPFYVGTVFVPQLTSAPDRPHPLILAFFRAVQAQAPRASRNA